MARLNQIIAVEKGIKSRSFQELTEAHQALQLGTYLPISVEHDGVTTLLDASRSF